MPFQPLGRKTGRSGTLKPTLAKVFSQIFGCKGIFEILKSQGPFHALFSYTGIAPRPHPGAAPEVGVNIAVGGLQGGGVPSEFDP